MVKIRSYMHVRFCNESQSSGKIGAVEIQESYQNWEQWSRRRFLWTACDRSVPNQTYVELPSLSTLARPLTRNHVNTYSRYLRRLAYHSRSLFSHVPSPEQATVHPSLRDLSKDGNSSQASCKTVLLLDLIDPESHCRAMCWLEPQHSWLHHQ